MEGAARVFAGEFSRATLLVPETGGGMSGWVVTPGGAWCHLMYIAGTLTEVDTAPDGIRCRLADPTGAFDLVIDGRSPALSREVGQIAIPSFVTVTGTAQLFRQNGNAVVTVRADQVRIVDRSVRDRWILVTAEQTIRRLIGIREALAGKVSDPRIERVLRHYLLTPVHLREMGEMAGAAVQGTVPAAPPGTGVLPGAEEIVMAVVREGSGPRGIAVADVIGQAGSRGLAPDAVRAALERLIREDECYQPQKGYIKPL